MNNNSWRVPASEPHSPECGDWGSLAGVTLIHRGELQVATTASKLAVLGNATYFVSKLPESGSEVAYTGFIGKLAQTNPINWGPRSTLKKHNKL